jgi:predicted nucleotide-binding protein
MDMTRTRVDEFVDRFPDFHNLGQTEQIVRLVYFHTVEERRETVNRAELEQMFRFAQLPVPPNLTQQLSYLSTRAKKLLNTNGEFALRRDLRKAIEGELRQAELSNSDGNLQREISNSNSRTSTDVEISRNVWVVYGRDERLRRGLFDFLRSLGLNPMEFSQGRMQTGKPMPYIGEILEAAFKVAQAIVVLLSPDDEARLRPDLQQPGDSVQETELTGQARPNVLFEAGMSLVSHPDRTILVQIGDVRHFSDIAGRHIVYMDDSTQRRQELANRLKDAGCPVNFSGTDWHTTGVLHLQEVNPARKVNSRRSASRAPAVRAKTRKVP